MIYPKPEVLEQEFRFQLIWLEHDFDSAGCNKAVAKIYDGCGNLMNEVTYFDIRFVCLDNDEDEPEDIRPYSGWFVHDGAKTTDVVHKEWHLNDT